MIKSVYPAGLSADVSSKAPIASPVFTGISDFSAGGAYFGTAAAANLLDDYEEGTWSPVISFGGGTTGITYDAFRGGSYVKVGRLVMATGYVGFTSKGSSTGEASISLPFTRETGSDYAGAPAFGNFGNLTYTGTLIGNMNTSSIGLFSTSEAGTRSDATDANFTNTSYITFTAIYYSA